MPLPLLPELSRDTAVAFDRRGSVRLSRFLADVERLAFALPEHRYVVNDCLDRYRFLVGFAAAMCRGQISLFPGSRVAHAWQQLNQDYADACCLTDQDNAPAVLPLVPYPADDSRGQAGANAKIPVFPASQIAAIAFTSGSTGRPKPAVRDWNALVQEARVGGKRLGLAPGQGGAIVSTVPGQHMYGFLAAAMFPLQFGYAICRERPFYPEDVRLALESSPATDPILVTAPMQLRACVLEKTRLPRPAFILSASAPLARAIAQEAEALFDTRVIEVYGSTEIGAFASRRSVQDDIWETFDGVKVSSEPETEGYRVEADYARESVLLSDVVEILSPTRFRLLGRNTDLIKIGGKRASLLNLNQQLQEIAGVQDGVFVLEDAVDGREPRLAAFVVALTRSREEILVALRARVDEAFVPRKLFLVPALPRNAVGKLPREQLLDLLRQQFETEPRGV